MPKCPWNFPLTQDCDVFLFSLVIQILYPDSGFPCPRLASVIESEFLMATRASVGQADDVDASSACLRPERQWEEMMHIKDPHFRHIPVPRV